MGAGEYLRWLRWWWRAAAAGTVARQAAASASSAGCDWTDALAHLTRDRCLVTGVFRLLRLAARCPVCGAPPALKISQRTVDKFDGCDPAEVVTTYQCQQCIRKGQMVHYEITAAAYQRAN